MGRRKICWKTRFWGPFLHLAPPYSRKVDILMVRDLKFWTFGTFRKHSLPVTDFKRLENLVFATVTCDTTLPTQKTSYQFRRERTVGQNSSYVLDCSLNSKLQNICDKTSTSRYLGLVNLLLFDLASYFLWATVLQFQTQKWHQSGALRLQFVDKNTARVVCWWRRLCSDPEFCKANLFVPAAGPGRSLGVRPWSSGLTLRVAGPFFALVQKASCQTYSSSRPGTNNKVSRKQ